VQMRAVVVVANPNPQSFSHAIAERVETGLRRAGHEVIVHDLYAEGFTAAMSAEEHAAYQTDHPVLDPLVQQHIDEIKSAHTVVFVYPTWWSSLPAILKGWFERVMVPGVGFVFNEQNKVRPGLTNVQQLVGITTYGSKWQYIKTINDNGKRTVKRALRMSTGWGTKSLWLPLYGMDTISAAKREEFLAKVEQKVGAL
jgi:NAD(P)H dehydrogenase (quinone)